MQLLFKARKTEEREWRMKTEPSHLARNTFYW